MKYVKYYYFAGILSLASAGYHEAGWTPALGFIGGGLLLYAGCVTVAGNA